MIAPGLYIPLSKCIYVWFQNSVVSDITVLDRQEKTNSYRDRFRKEILQLGQCPSPESFTSSTRASYRICFTSTTRASYRICFTSTTRASYRICFTSTTRASYRICFTSTTRASYRICFTSTTRASYRIFSWGEGGGLF